MFEANGGRITKEKRNKNSNQQMNIEKDKKKFGETVIERIKAN